MRKKIFHSILITSLGVLLAGLAVSATLFYYYFVNIQNDQLKSELQLAASGVEIEGIGYLEQLENGETNVKGFSDENLRLTLIYSDGNVLFDNVADINTMENHSDREEVKEAIKTGSGTCIRNSATMMEATIYNAVKLSNGQVLRLSVSRDTVISMMGRFSLIFVVAAIVASIISWIFAGKISKRIVEPINSVNLEKPLENNVYEEISPMLVDIHKQQKEIEAQAGELRRKTDEFNHITDGMKEGLILLDANKNILSINPAARTFFGVSSGDSEINYLIVDRTVEMSAAIDKALVNGHHTITERRFGRTLQIDISKVESEGKLTGLVVLSVDISSREQAERLRREFTANVSHELKTPLTSILASAELIQNGMVKPEDYDRFIGHIRTEATRLLSLIEDIIRLSKLDEGVELIYEEVNLGEVAAEVCSKLREKADENNIELKLYMEDCIIKSVSSLVHEIAYNLVENAIKYNKSEGEVQVSILSTARGAILEVKDTGIGIPSEEQDRIFERFYRSDKSHSKEINGTGLGLSIVKHSAAYLGAEIEVDSEVGKGTTMRVVF